MASRSRIVPAPIIGLALAHIAGTAIATLLSLSMAGVLIISLLALFGGCVYCRRLHPRTGLFALWALLAWAHTSLHLHPASERELVNQMEQPTEHLTLSGTIIAEPYEQRFSQQEDPVTYLPIKIDASQRTTQWKTTSGRLLVILNEPPENIHDLAYGDRIVVSGAVRQKGGPSIGLMKSRYRMYVAPEAIERSERNLGNPLLARCFKARAHLARILEIGMEDHPNEANILKALLLGYRSELDPERTQQFAQTGTLHLFAISGLHVGICGLIVIFFLKLFGIPRTHWILFLLPVLILFVATTGMKASAVRAGIMAIIYWGAPFLRRQPNVLTAMALAAMMVLIISPEQIGDAGFLFSFIIVSGMIMLIPILTEVFTAWLRPDEWAPDTAENQPGRVRKSAIWFGGYASVSTSAWITSLPLTAYFFNMFSPVALIGNLFAVAFAFAIVCCGMLSLFLGSLGSLGIPLAGFCNGINQKMIWLLLTLIGWLNDLPHAWQYVASPPLWIVFVYFGILIWIAHQRKISWPTAAVITASLISWTTYIQLREQAAYVEVYDVSPGQAALLKTPGSSGYLIDTGSEYHARTVLTALRKKGIDELDGVILTHSDISHLGALPQILETLPVHSVMLPIKYGSSKKAAEVFQLLEDKNIPAIELQRGDQGALVGQANFHVFNPDPESDFGSADDLSLILRISHQRTAVLFTGGMGLRAEKDLYDTRQDPGATVLITPNTSAYDALTHATINLIRPKTALVAGSSFNMNDGRIGRLREQRIDVFRIQDFGPARVDLKTGKTRFLNQP